MKSIVYLSIYLNGRVIVNNRAESLDLDDNEELPLNQRTDVVNGDLKKRLNDRQDTKVTMDTLDEHVKKYIPISLFRIIKAEQMSETHQVSGRPQHLTQFQFEVKTASQEPNPTIRKRGTQKRNSRY